MLTLELFNKKYETDTKELVIKGRNFTIHVPKSIDNFINHEDPLHNFPLWSKIWEASIILADHITGIPIEPSKRFLEIGSGLGIVGIAASSFGHQVTMTEYNFDALNFAGANARTNGLSPDSNPVIMKLDWNNPKIEGHFDYIVGSEVIYHERDFQPILGLFKKYLAPSGEIILAEGVRKTSMEFFRQMGRHFDIKARKKILRSKEKEIKIMLCTMHFKA